LKKKPIPLKFRGILVSGKLTNSKSGSEGVAELANSLGETAGIREEWYARGPQISRVGRNEREIGMLYEVVRETAGRDKVGVPENGGMGDENARKPRGL
jgi:hypothetical protein